MLDKSDTPISEVLGLFSQMGVIVSFLVPTETGLDKSIIDATAPLRRHLKDKMLHDYATQSQGEENKKIIKAFFVEESQLIETKASLYRPITKNGDPRIWFYKLQAYASANNLLAIVVRGDCIYVINASKTNILESANISSSPLYKLLENEAAKKSAASEELLSRLIEVSSKGFVASRKYSGDTAIGAQLAEELGIQVYDMSKGPDFKGIEIKAHKKSRGTVGGKTRVTLFSQIPDWGISKVKSGSDILRKYGYFSKRQNKRKLSVTIQAHRPNPQGLYFDIDYEKDWLVNLYKELNSEQTPEVVVNWKFEVLRNRLLEKHHESFFVGANVRVVDGISYFHYVDAEHTMNPITQNLVYLIDQGYITMDYTFSEKLSGAARDHGYLFKMFQKNFHLLLPRIAIYDLTQQSTQDFFVG